MNTKRAMKIAIRLAEKEKRRLAFNANMVRLGLDDPRSAREYEELGAAIRLYEKIIAEGKKR